MSIKRSNSSPIKSPYNHDIELAHLTLTEDIRLQVSAKLQQGVTIEKILDSSRDTVAEKMERKHLISRQDIHNIKRQYNIDGIERHSNDYTSVQAWVKECKTLDYNPIVVFKQQGNEDDTNDLRQNDFFLVIQTEFQRDMMTNFGDNIICVDATYRTNIYDFNLITVMVLDEYGEGIHVVWAVCNREDICALVQIFKHLKKRTGLLQPEVFMSDDAEQF